MFIVPNKISMMKKYLLKHIFIINLTKINYIHFQLNKYKSFKSDRKYLILFKLIFKKNNK